MSHKRYLVITPEQLKRLRGEASGMAYRLDADRTKLLARAASHPSYEDFLKYRQAFTQFLNHASREQTTPLSIAIQGPQVSPRTAPGEDEDEDEGEGEAKASASPPRQQRVRVRAARSARGPTTPRSRRASARPRHKAVQTDARLAATAGKWLRY